MVKYNLPQNVRSPKDRITDVKEIIHDGGADGGYSVAVIEWGHKTCIGIRWNVTERELENPAKANGEINCIGEPNSRGYSTWFVIPDDFLHELLNDGEISKKIKNYYK